MTGMSGPPFTPGNVNIRIAKVTFFPLAIVSFYLIIILQLSKKKVRIVRYKLTILREKSEL